MYEVDFLPVGDEGQSGDAIAIRYTRPDSGELAHVVIDAGFQDDGIALVDHVKTWFQTDRIELAILTHPDADHIGGMGEVVRGLRVGQLWLQDLAGHGGTSLPAAAAVRDLVKTAQAEGTQVFDVFAGVTEFGGSLRILGPDQDWYDELVAQQVEEEREGRGARRASSRVRKTARALADRFAGYLPAEIPFDDQGGTNPRNNTSTVTFIDLGGYRALLTGDAGVPALERAWNELGRTTGDTSAPGFMQIPHAGSRHNASSELLNRILGPTGQQEVRTAYASVASKSVLHPSARVVNAYIRRGCKVFETRGISLHHHGGGAPDRGWSAATPLAPMDESDEE
jgi:beta-lactamase superfamily II metal-dependent hydrolase